MKELDRKPIFFPRWLEAIVVLALLVMTGVELMHWQVFWALIFGLAALGFGISLIARTFKGDSHGPK